MENEFETAKELTEKIGKRHPSVYIVWNPLGRCRRGATPGIFEVRKRPDGELLAIREFSEEVERLNFKALLSDFPILGDRPIQRGD